MVLVDIVLPYGKYHIVSITLLITLLANFRSVIHSSPEIFICDGLYKDYYDYLMGAWMEWMERMDGWMDFYA